MIRVDELAKACYDSFDAEVSWQELDEETMESWFQVVTVVAVQCIKLLEKTLTEQGLNTTTEVTVDDTQT